MWAQRTPVVQWLAHAPVNQVAVGVSRILKEKHKKKSSLAPTSTQSLLHIRNMVLGTASVILTNTPTKAFWSIKM